MSQLYYTKSTNSHINYSDETRSTHQGTQLYSHAQSTIGCCIPFTIVSTTLVPSITPSYVSLWVIVLSSEQFLGKFVVGLSEWLHLCATEVGKTTWHFTFTEFNNLLSNFSIPYSMALNF